MGFNNRAPEGNNDDCQRLSILSVKLATWILRHEDGLFSKERMSSIRFYSGTAAAAATFELSKQNFSNFSCMVLNPNNFSNLNYNCSIFIDLRNLFGRLSLFHHSIDMRTTFNVSIS